MKIKQIEKMIRNEEIITNKIKKNKTNKKLITNKIIIKELKSDNEL